MNERLRSGTCEHGLGIIFWKGHGHQTFTDVFYNCVSSGRPAIKGPNNNSTTDRRVPGRPLPNTKPVKTPSKHARCLADNMVVFRLLLSLMIHNAIHLKSQLKRRNLLCKVCVVSVNIKTGIVQGKVKNFPAVQPRFFGALQFSTIAFRVRRIEA